METLTLENIVSTSSSYVIIGTSLVIQTTYTRKDGSKFVVDGYMSVSGGPAP